MPRTRSPYPAEFREQIVALVRTGRSPEDLAKGFEPCAHTIYGWVRQAGRSGDAAGWTLKDDERDELRRRREENKQLRLERDILSKGEPSQRHRFEPMANAWFARNAGTSFRSSSS